MFAWDVLSVSQEIGCRVRTDLDIDIVFLSLNGGSFQRSH